MNQQPLFVGRPYLYVLMLEGKGFKQEERNKSVRI